MTSESMKPDQERLSEQDKRGGHYDWHEDDCAWKIAREALDTTTAQAVVSESS